MPESLLMKKRLFKIETLAQVFSCEFYEISKDTFFAEHLRVTASKEPHWLHVNNFNYFITPITPLFLNVSIKF